MIPRAQVKMHSDEIDAAIDVLRSGRLVKGPENEDFAREFARFCGSKYAIPTNSGASALFTSLLAANKCERGDIVITVPNTFVATVSAIIQVGAVVRFADINPETYTMDPQSVRDLIKRLSRKKTPKAIIPVHLYGHPVEMGEISEIAEEHDMLVVEDACQAHGSEYRHRRVGSIGDVGTFSFFPTKNMTTGGEGGMITTNSEDIADAAKALTDHGRSRKGQEYLGYNFRMSEIHAAIGRVQLQKLPAAINSRRRLAQTYSEILEKNAVLSPPKEAEHSKHVYYTYMVRCNGKKREKIMQILQEKEVETSLMYPKLIPDQYPRFRSLIRGVPVARQTCRELFALPMYPDLDGSSLFRKVENALNSLNSDQELTD